MKVIFESVESEFKTIREAHFTFLNKSFGFDIA
jgi:hypothetical protein